MRLDRWQWAAVALAVATILIGAALTALIVRSVR